MKLLNWNLVETWNPCAEFIEKPTEYGDVGSIFKYESEISSLNVQPKTRLVQAIHLCSSSVFQKKLFVYFHNNIDFFHNDVLYKTNDTLHIYMQIQDKEFSNNSFIHKSWFEKKIGSTSGSFIKSKTFRCSFHVNAIGFIQQKRYFSLENITWEMLDIFNKNKSIDDF